MNLSTRQFFTFLHKCWIQRKRHYLSTFFELVVPLLISTLIVWVNTKKNLYIPLSTEDRGSVGLKNATIYDYPLPEDQLETDNVVVLFSPNDTFTTAICKQTKNIFDTRNINSNFTGFSSESALMAFHRSMSNTLDVINFVVLIFHRKRSDDKSLKLDIRLPWVSLDGLDRLYDNTPGPPVVGQEKFYGWLGFIQKSVSEGYLTVLAEDKNWTRTNFEVEGYRFPYPSYFKTHQTLMSVVPTLTVLGFSISSTIIVKRLVDEKEIGSKDLLAISGLNDWIFWSSTFVNYFLVYLFQALAFTFMYCTDFKNANSAIVKNSDPVLVFALFLLYGISFILASLLISIPFNNVLVAVIVSLTLWILSYIAPCVYTDSIAYTGIDSSATEWQRIIFCFIPNMGLNFGLRIISETEAYDNGVTFSNLIKPLPSGALGSLSFGLVLILQLSSIIVMVALIPFVQFLCSKKKSFCFPSSLSCRCPKIENSDCTEDVRRCNIEHFEPQLSTSKVTVRISNLRKEFGFGLNRKAAVVNISLDINHGQITALLGHSGAGKTTTMHMIAGLYRPKSGAVLVNGYSVATRTEGGRSLSLCPQHNVLYNELTVHEHLALYARMKGVRSEGLYQEVMKTAKQVDLLEELNTQSCALSGGMKRKLCLGMALIGNTEVLILDEPTAGMDPEARRKIWDLLLSIKHARTILLTTQYMAEADALADRIAIMVSGELKCCGTPMFLKNTFGSGYRLRITKALNFKKENTSKAIVRHFPHASIKSETETEIVFSLERSSEGRRTVTQAMPLFFTEFEAIKNEIGVASCGLSIATMEDVFIAVNQLDEHQPDDGFEVAREMHENVDGSANILHNPRSSNFDRLRGFRLQVQRFKGIVLKRLNFAKRHIPVMILQFIVPCVIFLFLLRLDNALRTMARFPTRLELNLSKLYGRTTAFYAKEASMNTSIMQNYYGELLAKERASSFTIMHNTSDTVQVISEGILDESKRVSLFDYSHTYLVGIDIGENPTKGVYLNYWCNLKALQSRFISMNMVYNAILKNLTFNDPAYSIQIATQFLPFQQILTDYIEQLLLFLWLLVICLSFPLYSASYVLFPVHERTSKIKLLQLLCGIHPMLLWLANFVFDFLTYVFSFTFIFLTFLLVDSYGIFTGGFQSYASLLLTFTTFGMATIPFSYVVSFLFKNPSSAYVVTVFLSLMLGSVLSVVDFASSFYFTCLFEYTFPCKNFAIIAQLFPNVAFCKAILKIYDAGSDKLFCSTREHNEIKEACDRFEFQKHSGDMSYKLSNMLRCCPPPSYSDICTNEYGDNEYCYTWERILSWQEPGVLKQSFFMVVDSLLFFALLLAIEMNCFRLFSSVFKWLHKHIVHIVMRPWGFTPYLSNSTASPQNSTRDEDVLGEENRIESLINTENFEESLVAANIYKSFKEVHAVKGLTFEVKSQECLGLLGVNGAGKTTVFRILVGDLSPTKGAAYFGKYNTRSSLRQFQRNIGYCPQTHALLGKLTGRETLYMFGRLRGVRESCLSSLVNELIEMLDLTKCSDKKVEHYSGGLKRRLSLGVALIGSPKFLLLDEPSTGVDPETRRRIWKTLAFMREYYGCSIVLASHHMDECEAHCSRVAIMVNGEIKCIGSVQHLKTRFGRGYTIFVKFKPETFVRGYVNVLRGEIRKKIRDVVVRSVNETVVTIHVPNPSTKIGSIFRLMSDVEEKLDLQDYAVSNTTLEHIFIAFAREQAAPESLPLYEQILSW